MFSFYLTGFKKILNIAKKIFLVLAVYLVVISLFFYFLAKDKPKTTIDPIKKNREEIYKVINDPQLNKTKEGKLTIAFYRLTMCGLIGEACTDNPDDGDKNFSHSVFGFITNLLVLPYANPPASGVYWAYSGLQNAGFVPKTYAAEGIGFAAIKSLKDVWIVFRNFTFMLLVLVIITIGFMIMFRAKINPQTVISVENALPKIIITLILINFSFAIAGFLIDLMYLSIAIIVSLLATASGLDQASTIGHYLTAGPWTIFGLFFAGKDFWSKFTNFVNIPINIISLFGPVFKLIIITISSLLFAFFFTMPAFYKIGGEKLLGEEYIPELQGQPAGVGISWKILSGVFKSAKYLLLTIISLVATPPLLWGLLLFFIVLTFIFLFFRIIFTLISAYIKILLLILFSPLIILMNAIPGQSPFNFESWLKNLIGELITFPLIIAIFMVGSVIVNTLSSNEVMFTPPFLIGLNPQSLIFIFGMGILYMIPDLIKIFKQLILPKALPLPEVGPGVFFAGASAALGGALEQTGKWGTTIYHAKYIAPIIEKITGVKILKDKQD